MWLIKKLLNMIMTIIALPTNGSPIAYEIRVYGLITSWQKFNCTVYMKNYNYFNSDEYKQNSLSQLTILMNSVFCVNFSYFFFLYFFWYSKEMDNSIFSKLNIIDFNMLVVHFGKQGDKQMIYLKILNSLLLSFFQ